ncbi:beta-ketoacyl synthase N-terminal-like domain-containing protein [Streptomyces sp. SCL15-6]|uniref:beta-ketoacyl synthase N-terminal-like domain-containing protein n=1 Tax=Streptomyces sp. SCL15-6 TaxID=2967222 RepID=UPI0039900CA8
MDRSTQMAMAATTEALQPADLDPEQWDGARLGVVLATAPGGMTTWEREYGRCASTAPAQSHHLIPMASVNMTAGHVAAAYEAKGPNFATATPCASSTTAWGAARDLLRSDLCDMVIAGGTRGQHHAAGRSRLRLNGSAVHPDRRSIHRLSPVRTRPATARPRRRRFRPADRTPEHTRALGARPYRPCRRGPDVWRARRPPMRGTWGRRRPVC